jgi:predicted PurR-regulated permease PerM
MYVMVVLCMVQLYKNRHSDVSLSHNLAFILLGLYILLATVGLLTEEVAVVAVFMTINTLVCIFLSLKAYFLGPVWDNLRNLTSQLRNRQHRDFHLLKPRRKGTSQVPTIDLTTNLLQRVSFALEQRSPSTLSCQLADVIFLLREP